MQVCKNVPKNVETHLCGLNQVYICQIFLNSLYVQRKITMKKHKVYFTEAQSPGHFTEFRFLLCFNLVKKPES